MLEDIVWTDHVTTGNGLHNGSKLVVSIWERLDDSISREKHHPLYPCRFIVEVIGRSLPNSLQSPRAHSPTLIVRFNLMPSILHCQCFNPYIIHYGVFLSIIHWSNYLHLSFVGDHVSFINDYMSFYIIKGSRHTFHCLLVRLANTNAILGQRIKFNVVPYGMQALLRLH